MASSPASSSSSSSHPPTSPPIPFTPDSNETISHVSYIIHMSYLALPCLTSAQNRDDTPQHDHLMCVNDNSNEYIPYIHTQINTYSHLIPIRLFVHSYIHYFFILLHKYTYTTPDYLPRLSALAAKRREEGREGRVLPMSASAKYAVLVLVLRSSVEEKSDGDEESK